MKKKINHLMAMAFMATQVLSISAYGDSLIEKIADKVKEKIQDSRISVGAGVDLKLDVDRVLRLSTGIDYEYVLDPDMGKYLREDKWADHIMLRAGLGLTAERRIERHMAYGRFFSDWNTALRTFLFSPLDLKGLSAEKLKQMMLPGDMISVTFEKATFLGLHGQNPGTISVTGAVGRVLTGKITVKILKRADGKLTIRMANADENAIRLAANARITIIPGLLKLRFLSFDHDAHLRGQADLATYTYDLNNARSAAVLDKLLSALDEPTILADENMLKEGIDLDTNLSSGLIDVTESELASHDVTTGVGKEQELTSNIVSGQRSDFRLNLGILTAGNRQQQTTNLVDIKMSGTFIQPGQYIVGHRTNLDRSGAFGQNERIYNVTSVVYKPDPILQEPSQARGYRGLDDLIGISYHTEAKQRSNSKEMITYVKLCNAGLIECNGPMRLSVVDPESPQASESRVKSTLNTNYFFSRGMFEQIKSRLNWAGRSKEARTADIQARIAPIVSEMVLDGAEERTRSLSRFFHEVLDNNCYSNLIGMDAQRSRDLFKRMFSEKCGTNLYNISDDLIRLNMPSLLISLFNPDILPALNQTNDRAADADKADLAQYFSVTFNTKYITTDDVEKTVNGAVYGMSLTDRNSASAQVLEFTGLINNWQQQQNLSLDQFDRLLMLGQQN